MHQRTEKEIMKNWKGDSAEPVVNISTITYNHEDYIGEALDGFLMQETDFPFNVLIAEDCSTDNTADIIREYEKKYPNIIKPIYQKENQYSKGVDVVLVFNFSRAKGKYIALCEGDDYWTDPEKLQKQVDLLDNNKQVYMSFQNALIKEYDKNGNIKNTCVHTIDIKSGIIQPAEILRTKIVPTASVVFRNRDLKNFAEKIKDFPVGDTPLFLYFSKFGAIYYQDEITSVYRLLPAGLVKSTLGSLEVSKSFVRYYKSLEEMFPELELSETIYKLISSRYKYIIKLSMEGRDYRNIIKYTLTLLRHDPVYFLKSIYRVISGLSHNPKVL